MKFKDAIVILGASFLCNNLPAFAESLSQSSISKAPETIVTAERYPYPKSEVSSSITILDAKDIADSQKENVADVLKGVPGVDVVQSGGPGGNVAVFIRGANSEHTLVYIDGIEANDPISPTRTFDFANLSTDNIEQIEVVRGPQSVLYGSDAIGGVILITTKKGSGVPHGSVSVEGGSYGSTREKVSVSGGDEITNYSLSVSQRDTDGFSSAAQSNGNNEKDGYSSTNVSAQGGVTPNKYIDGNVVLRYSNARSELDNFGGAFGDDPNRVIYDNQLLARTEVGTHLLEGRLDQKYGITLTDQWYDDNNGVDAQHPTDSTLSNYNGKLYKFDVQNNLKITDAVSSLFGFENKTEQGSSSYVSESSFGPFSDILADRSVTSNGYYLQGRWNLDDTLVSSAGMRVDDHSKFGTKTTWKAGPTLLLGDTKISGNVGSGYKAPSIFQLYSSYGNQDLKPEESLGWDAGVEQDFWHKNVTVGVTYFQNDFDNLITFNPNSFVSENIAKAKSHGIEGYGSAKLSKQFRIDGSYTFTDTEDKTTGLELLRRARNKAKVGVSYSPVEKGEVGVEVLLNGKRVDNDFSTAPATRADLGGYALINLVAKYGIVKDIELFGRVENMFDKSYQDVLGYGTAGATVFGGVKYDF